MQKVKEISLAHYHQGVSSSNEYAPICNTKMDKKILKSKSSTLIWEWYSMSPIHASEKVAVNA